MNTSTPTLHVAPTFDSGDIGKTGHWEGARVGCLNCRFIVPMILVPTARYLTNALVCGECYEVMAEVEI